MPGERYSGAEDPTELGFGEEVFGHRPIGFLDVPAPIRVATIAPASGAIRNTVAAIGPAP